MKIPKEKLDELQEIAKPIVKWLRENCHPHTEIVIGQINLVINENVAGLMFNTFDPESLK